MAKKTTRSGKTKSKAKVSRKPKAKKKKVVGEFGGEVKKKWKRRKVKGKTELRRFKTGAKKGQTKSVSIVIENKRKKDSIENLDQFADDIQNDKDFNKKLGSIFYRNKIKKKVGRKWKTITVPPFTCVVIIEQRDRRDRSNFHYEPYFMAPPATKENVRNHTVNTVRNHAEFIRRRIVTKRWGFGKKYDFGNFHPWFVPSIRIELLYE